MRLFWLEMFSVYFANSNAVEQPPLNTLGAIETWSGIASDIVVALTILIGGGWTFWVFVIRRERRAKAGLIQEVSWNLLPDGRKWIRVDLIIRNTGMTLVKLGKIEIRVQQCLPLDTITAIELKEYVPRDTGRKSELTWPLLDQRITTFKNQECEVEPGSDEHFGFDFVIAGKHEKILVQTFVRNMEKRRKGSDMGWIRETILSVSKQSEGD